MIDHDDNVIDLNVILHPGSVYDHPSDVVADPTLSVSEKRAILASWASMLPPWRQIRRSGNYRDHSAW